jgi:hypothetical protein
VESFGAELRQTLGIGDPVRVESVERGRTPAPETPPKRPAARRSAVPLNASPAALDGSPADAPKESEPAAYFTLEDVPASPDAGGRTANPVEAMIYSSEDADVRPPALIYPQLPAPAVLNAPMASVNRMEVVVSALGEVERVRLIAGPRRMPDMMLLSGAKAWRFSPATKDDLPVRYRAILSWNSAP